MAILNGSRGDRPHCIYRGFCIQGCKVGAKASTLITHVPDAIANGAEIRPNCMVSRIARGPGPARHRSQLLRCGRARAFSKSEGRDRGGYAIETPRLLLNSACPGFENGLANSSDCVGRYLMAQAGNVIMRPLRPTGPHVQSAARARPDRRVLRDRSRDAVSRAASRSRRWGRCRWRSPSR